MTMSMYQPPGKQKRKQWSLWLSSTEYQTISSSKYGRDKLFPVYTRILTLSISQKQSEVDDCTSYSYVSKKLTKTLSIRLPAKRIKQTEAMNLIISQIDAGLFRHNLQSFLLHCFQSLAWQPQLHKALAFFPPQPLVLQICKLQMLSSVVRERDPVPIVCFLACQITYPACNPSQQWHYLRQRQVKNCRNSAASHKNRFYNRYFNLAQFHMNTVSNCYGW